MAKQPTIYEILRDANNQKEDKDKAQVLKDNSSAPLKTVIGYAYDPRVKWMLPHGIGPYTENRDREGMPRLNRIASKLEYFVDGPSLIKNRIKRENLFLSMLGEVDPGDALVLIAIKERKLPFESLTREVIEKAFPNMTKDWPKEEAKSLPPKEPPKA